jgi:DNA-binding CsgD family transcriptional regulator
MMTKQDVPLVALLRKTKGRRGRTVYEFVHPETQARHKLHEAVAEAWAKRMQESKKGASLFPPVVLFVDAQGVYRIGDGFHRILSALLAGFTAIPAVIKPGGIVEALRWNVKQNKKADSIQFVEGDCRRSVMQLLLHDPEARDLTASQLARVVGCSRSTVEVVRGELIADGRIEPKFRRIASDVRQEVVRRFRDNQSKSQIARELHIGYQTVSIILAGAGIDVGETVNATPPDVQQEVVRRFRDKQSKSQIARELGLANATVQRIVAANGLERVKRPCPHCNGRGFSIVVETNKP